MLNLCTTWKELGKYKGSVGVTKAFIKLTELVYHENKADPCISVTYPEPWETGSWQGHWETLLQGCKSTGRRLEPRSRNSRWIRGIVAKQPVEICHSLQNEK